MLSYATAEDKLLFAEEWGGTLSISSIDLNTGISRVETNYYIGEDSGDWGWFDLSDADYAPDENALYLMIQYNYRNQSNKGLILKYDVQSKSVSIINDGQAASGETINSSRFAYSTSGLLLINKTYLGGYRYTSNGIQSLALDGADLTQVSSEPDLSPLLLTVDEDSGIAYSTGWNGVETINLATGEKQVLSAEEGLTDLNFSQLRYTDLDKTNQQLLVADSDLDMVVSVNLDTGQRSRFLHHGVGSGKALINPFDFAFDNKNNIAYIADDGGNGPEVVLAVDLTTGNRIQVGDINQPFNVWIEDIVLDQVAQKLYVIFGDKIVKLDILTGESESILINDSGVLGNIGYLHDATLNKTRNELLVADSQHGRVFALNLDTSEMTIISSSADAVGVGEGIEGVYNIVAGEEPNVLYAAAFSEDKTVIYSIDLISGNRERLLNTCGDSNTFTELDTMTVSNMTMSNNELIILSDKKLTVDLETSVCTSANAERLFDISITDKGQVLGLRDKALHQIDYESGQSVIISK